MQLHTSESNASMMGPSRGCGAFVILCGEQHAEAFPGVVCAGARDRGLRRRRGDTGSDAANPPPNFVGTYNVTMTKVSETCPDPILNTAPWTLTLQGTSASLTVTITALGTQNVRT